MISAWTKAGKDYRLSWQLYTTYYLMSLSELGPFPAVLVEPLASYGEMFYFPDSNGRNRWWTEHTTQADLYETTYDQYLVRYMQLYTTLPVGMTKALEGKAESSTVLPTTVTKALEGKAESSTVLPITANANQRIGIVTTGESSTPVVPLKVDHIYGKDYSTPAEVEEAIDRLCTMENRVLIQDAVDRMAYGLANDKLLMDICDEELPLHYRWKQQLIQMMTPTEEIGRFIMAFSHKNENNSSAVYLEGIKPFISGAWDRFIQLKAECTVAGNRAQDGVPSITRDDKRARDTELFNLTLPVVILIINMLFNIEAKGAGDSAVLAAISKGISKYPLPPVTGNVSACQGTLPDRHKVLRIDQVMLLALWANALILGGTAIEDRQEKSKSSDLLWNVLAISSRGIRTGSLKDMQSTLGERWEIDNIYRSKGDDPDHYPSSILVTEIIGKNRNSALCDKVVPRVLFKPAEMLEEERRSTFVDSSEMEDEVAMNVSNVSAIVPVLEDIYPEQTHMLTIYPI